MGLFGDDDKKDREGVQVPEHVGLRVQRFSGGDTAALWYRPTRVGVAALQAGNIRELILG
jgi:hypothetical protein